MKIYNYMQFNITSSDVDVQNILNKYANNIFIKNQNNIYSQTVYHDFDYELYPQEFDLDEGEIGRSLPLIQYRYKIIEEEGQEVVTPDGYTVIDNPLFLIKDLNTRENGTPIYYHLD